MRIYIKHRDSVSSAIQTPWISSKILCYALYFQLSSWCLDIPMKHCHLCLIYYIKTTLLKSVKKTHNLAFPVMRVFQSISGHSNELSIANHSSQPTVSELKWVSDIKSNWFKNHQPQKTKISTITNVHLIENSNQMGFSQLLQYLMQHPSFWAHRAALLTKIDVTFPAFSLKFVDFAAQFCFRCGFSFHEERSTNIRLHLDSHAVIWGLE